MRGVTKCSLWDTFLQQSAMKVHTRTTAQYTQHTREQEAATAKSHSIYTYWEVQHAWTQKMHLLSAHRDKLTPIANQQHELEQQP